MNRIVFRLALQSIKYRRSTIALSILSIALSVALILGIERIRSSVKESFTSTISGTDLIVGARTGDLSLLLSTVFQKGNVTQNVSWDTYETIRSNPKVNWTIPIALGDSHKGYAVVGTNGDFFKYFKYGPQMKLVPSEGQNDIHDMNCVIGAKVAKDLGYAVSEQLVLTHGMGSEDFSNHKEDPFYIAGILSPTGTPIDNCLFVSITALDHIHDEFYQYDDHAFDPLAHDHHHAEEDQHPEALTGFYIGVNNKSDIPILQRTINTEFSEPLLAIMPAVTLLELWNTIKPIENVLLSMSLLVLLISLGSVLTSIISNLDRRRREMAVLRSIGARPQLIFGLITIESAGIVLSGLLLGTIGLFIILMISKPFFIQNFGINFDLWVMRSNELFIVLIVFLSGVIIGLLPAFQTYKRALSDGLTIKH